MMGNRGKTGIWVVVGVLVAATLIAIYMRQREYHPDPVIEAGSPTVPPAQGTPASESTDPQASSPVVSTPSASSGAPPAVADPEFQEWVTREAKDLDNPQVNAAEKKRLIRNRVSRLTSAQSRQLLQTVKDPQAPAGEKILSTYLLVEGGVRSQRELTDLITSPLQENPNYKPHSEEEMKGIREKSLRIMAIDGLFSQAQREPSARDALARAARETTDPSIRAYAEDKLRQLQ